jgi:hypothetical protein
VSCEIVSAWKVFHRIIVLNNEILKQMKLHRKSQFMSKILSLMVMKMIVLNQTAILVKVMKICLDKIHNLWVYVVSYFTISQFYLRYWSLYSIIILLMWKYRNNYQLHDILNHKKEEILQFTCKPKKFKHNSWEIFVHVINAELEYMLWVISQFPSFI